MFTIYEGEEISEESMVKIEGIIEKFKEVIEILDTLTIDEYEWMWNLHSSMFYKQIDNKVKRYISYLEGGVSKNRAILNSKYIFEDEVPY